MKPKLLLCLALVLSGQLSSCRAATTNTIASSRVSVDNIVNPQSSVELPRLGHAIFREQTSEFSLQVPVGFRESGKRTDTKNPALQVWLLTTDGTAVRQFDHPSTILIGSIGEYATDYMFFTFDKIPANELAGVVVSLNGKLYCHEIEASNPEPAMVRDDGDMLHISSVNISRGKASHSLAARDTNRSFVKITFAKPLTAPSQHSLPAEALLPSGFDTGGHGAFTNVVAGQISAMNVTWADPKYFSTDNQVPDFLNKLLSSPSETFTWHVWSFADTEPILIATVEHKTGKPGKLFVWALNYPNVYWAYLDATNKWWWSMATFKTPTHEQP